jgi:NAD(P)-dependent dehydrogenase (short-subunit alcohol dehydrogenase family)
MTARFTNKVVLVTGGGSGIGRSSALAFAREGATVVVAGRSAEPLDCTVALVEAQGGRASAVVADVARADDVAGLVETVVARHGGLHIAFNNAGIVGTPNLIADLDEATWSAVLATNLTGVWRSMKYEIAHMRVHGGGAIINMASTFGAHAAPSRFGAYVAAKAGVSALTRTAAREYIGEGIRINAVSPGPVDTPMSRRPGETEAERDARARAEVPLGRVGTTEEIAAAVLWLASPESGFVVGHDLIVDGGVTA